MLSDIGLAAPPLVRTRSQILKSHPRRLMAYCMIKDFSFNQFLCRCRDIVCQARCPLITCNSSRQHFISRRYSNFCMENEVAFCVSEACHVWMVLSDKGFATPPWFARSETENHIHKAHGMLHDQRWQLQSVSPQPGEAIWLGQMPFDHGRFKPTKL